MPTSDEVPMMTSSATLDCGWGRLLFGQTFQTAEEIADVLNDEKEGRRDVAFYVRDPHIVLASAPQSLFLDPSHTFRLDLQHWDRKFAAQTPGVKLRRATAEDEAAINRLYLSRNMVPVAPGFCKRWAGVCDHRSCGRGAGRRRGRDRCRHGRRSSGRLP